MAPSWSVKLSILDPKDGTPPISIADSDSLYKSVAHDITTTTPYYEELLRRLGRSRTGRVCGVVELGGVDNSITVVMSVDSLIFRRAGDIWTWGNRVTFQLRRKTVEGMPADQFARLLFDSVCLSMDPWYAHAELTDEFSSKNIKVDKSGTRAIGVDISKSLPGLYWLNYFGNACVDEIGRSRFVSCPAFETREMKSGVSLSLASGPMEWSKVQYISRELDTMASLGQEFFFLRGDQQLATRSPFVVEQVGPNGEPL